jgi:hypothetical protein
MKREEYNAEQKRVRADLRRRGICVDCRKNDAFVNPETRKVHVCCSDCLEKRRDRCKNGPKTPLLKLIEKVNSEGLPARGARAQEADA